MATPMGIWDCLQKTALINKLRQNYKQPFPVEVRYYHKEWIEQNFIKKNLKLNPNDPVNYGAIVGLLRRLCIGIDNTIQKFENQIPTLDCERIQLVTAKVQILNQSRNVIRASYETPAQFVTVYKHIHHILVSELLLLQENGLLQNPTQASQPNLQVLNNPTGGQNPSIGFSSPTYDLNVQLQNLQIGLDPIIKQNPGPKSLNYLQSLQSFLNQMYCLYSRLNEVRRRVLADLATWQSSAAVHLSELDEIESSHKNAVAISKSCQILVSQLKMHLKRDPIDGISADDIESMFFEIHGSLIMKALVIEKPPMQVLRTCTNFEATVRCLLDNSSFTIGTLKSLVMKHADFMELLKKSKVCSRMTLAGSSTGAKESTPKAKPRKGKRGPMKPKAESIVGGTGALELVVYDSTMERSASPYLIGPAYPWLYANQVEWTTGDHLVASLNRVKVAGKGAKRDKQTKRTVLHESFFMIFHTEVSEVINGETRKWWIWTASPKSNRITTNKIQDIFPHEALVWCSAADIGERNSNNQYSGDNLPDRLPWKKVSAALSEWFREMTNAGLNQDHLDFLRSKLGCAPDDTPDDHITRNQFCEKKLPGRNFTFWEWFYKIAELTAGHLSAKGSTGKKKIAPLWEEGKIIGFIDKEEATNRLRRCRKGTFLLRFSDSVLGAITIGYIGHDVIYHMPEENVLKVSPLANLIMNLEDIKFLFPNTPKTEAFGHHVVDGKPKVNGYVRTCVRYFTSWSRRNPNPTTDTSAAIETNEAKLATPLPQANQGQYNLTPAGNELMNHEPDMQHFANTFPPTPAESSPVQWPDQYESSAANCFPAINSGIETEMEILDLVDDLQGMEVDDAFLKLFDSGGGIAGSGLGCEIGEVNQASPDTEVMTYQNLETGNPVQVNGHTMDTDVAFWFGHVYNVQYPQ